LLIAHATGRRNRVRSAAAGIAAAAVWAVQEPLDRRLFDSDYSDVALLGKAVTSGTAWPVVGLAIHLANGALFGLVFHEARRLSAIDQRKLALGMALAEHLALYPLFALVDRHHPARGTAGVPPMVGSGRGFVHATWRHAIFGIVLGRLA
jgi:hypothetical protein